MGHLGKIINWSIAISFVIWSIGLAFLMPLFTDSSFFIYTIIIPLPLLVVVTLIFALGYMAANPKPGEGSGTLSEQIQRGVELLKECTAPRALPQALMGEFNITQTRARKVAGS